MAAVRHRDRLVGQQKQPGQADRHRGPDHRGLRGVERSELKLNTMNRVHRNITPTSGAIQVNASMITMLMIDCGATR